MQLTKNFTLSEMLESQTARRRDFREQFTPPAMVVESLKKLCENILQPIRNKVGPIKVSSGYRCSRLNKSVGGASTSQHLLGEAADIQAIKGTNKELFDVIVNGKLPFDQVIWEYGDNNEPAWVHVSFGPRNRRQILYIPKHLAP